MRERLLFVVGGLLLGAAFWWTFVTDPGRIPMLDFNRQVLAETEVEGYCAGDIYWNTRGAGNAAKAKQCRLVNTDLSVEVDHARVLPAFCLGAQAAGFAGDLRTACEEPIRMATLWPTMDGQLTSSFDESKGYPYPGNQVLEVPPGDSRTGSRDGFSRDDEPTETTTTTEGAE